MSWFGGFQCYYSSWTCGLTCEAWGWGRSSLGCYESWCETTVDRAWSKREAEGEGRVERDRKAMNSMSDRRHGKVVRGISMCRSNPEHLSCPGVSAQHPLYFLSYFFRALPSHLAIVLDRCAFWQLCLECCDGSLEGRVCMSGCALSDGL